VVCHAQVQAEADALHLAAVFRADQIAGCVEGSPEERELAAIRSAVEAYEAKRCPEGRALSGQG
jgi:hypothetical protein